MGLMPSSPNDDPFTIAVTRGDLAESRHHVIAAVVDAKGGIVHRWGDIDRLIYPRSAVKPLQAVPLVLHNVDLDDRHLALAAASHNGEPMHVDLVLSWLAALGHGAAQLECGAHEPIDGDSARALIETRRQPGPEHNNCSGKHCGFLALARKLAVLPAGYINHDHPVQTEVRRTLAQLTGLPLERAIWGVDGCGIPTYAMPLAALARAFACFAAPGALADDMAAATTVIFNAVSRHPYLVGGRNRFDTAVMSRYPAALMVKSGAEGVCAASIPNRGLGIVTKVVDGARRASDVAMAAVLRHVGVIDDAGWEALQVYASPVVRNVAGRPVGAIHVCEKDGA